MKKGVIIFTIILSMLSFSSCGTQNGNSEKTIVNTQETEVIDVEPTVPSATSEPEATQSSIPVITPEGVNNSGESANQDEGLNYSDSDKQLIEDLDSDVYEKVTYEISTPLHDDMPEYRFVATGVTRGEDEWSTGFVMGLEVYDEKGISLLSADFSQSLNDEVIGNPVYNQMMDTMGLHASDVNFDGYRDVIILNTFGGAHSNTWYDCWLWNPSTSSFVRSQSFADICNPALDPENKCIYSTGGSGAGSHQWVIYHYIDSEFVVTNSLSCEESYEGYYFTEQKLVNGKMDILREDVIKADSFDDALTAAGYIDDELWQLNNQRWYGIGGHQADQWLE